MRYRRLLTLAIISRVFMILLAVSLLLLFHSSNYPFLTGLATVVVGLFSWLNAKQIIDYLAMDEEEFIEQIKWEMKK